MGSGIEPDPYRRSAPSASSSSSNTAAPSSPPNFAAGTRRGPSTGGGWPRRCSARRACRSSPSSRPARPPGGPAWPIATPARPTTPGGGASSRRRRSRCGPTTTASPSAIWRPDQLFLLCAVPAAVGGRELPRRHVRRARRHPPRGPGAGGLLVRGGRGADRAGARRGGGAAGPAHRERAGAGAPQPVPDDRSRRAGRALGAPRTVGGALRGGRRSRAAVHPARRRTLLLRQLSRAARPSAVRGRSSARRTRSGAGRPIVSAMVDVREAVEI